MPINDDVRIKEIKELAPPSHVPPETVLLHPSTALAFCAAVTTRLRLGTGGSLAPTGVVIDSVRLELRLTKNPDLIARPIRVYRVLADWGEGASDSPLGQGAPAQPGDTTWLNSSYPGSLWSNPGGDVAAVAVGAQSGKPSTTAAPRCGGFSWSRTSRREHSPISDNDRIAYPVASPTYTL
jgi:hypothetical protein